MNRFFAHVYATLPRLLRVVVFSAIMCEASAGAAGLANEKIDSALRQVLLTADSVETRTVIVFPQVSSDEDSMERDYGSKAFRDSLIGMTRGQRYDFVRARLNAQARQTKKALQSPLDSLLHSGAILSYRNHWLLGAYSVTLPLKHVAGLSALQRVKSIILPPAPELIPFAPEQVSRATNSFSGSVESNLESVRARAVWSQGYTGSGRIVCSFDTGIEGIHPALRRAWQGYNGDSAAAWFDPVDRLPYPHVFSHTSLPEHGSHTMGIMVGRDTASGDTVGVAPGAKWISAAVIDIPGASIVDAFEWAADPDRDPNTIADVPDVINHSWGVPNSVLGCDALFHRLIDNTEALGIVNIFAAGNEGKQGAQTIRNPANRARDSIDCLAVGYVNHRTPGAPSLAASSSRGPSDCDGTSVKPNVVAPGVNIRSCLPNFNYGFRSGSSMAAPHVAGIVALLRQKNPDASPEQIKSALLVGARDLGESGADNNYGWGYINALEALEALPEPAQPALRVTALSPNRPDARGILRARVRLENISVHAATASNVRGQIISAPASVTMRSGSVTFGSMAAGVALTSAEEIEIEVADTLSAGSVIPLDFLITADNGVRQLDKLFVLIGERVSREFYTHRSDRMSFTVSNFGEYGFADDSYTPLGFSGLRFEDEPRSSLFEMAFVIGLDKNHVSDGIRNIGLEPDRDFSPSPGGAIEITTLDSVADFSTFSVFADTLAEIPLGLTVRQRTYGWRHAPLDNVVALDYTIVNNSRFGVGGVYVGIFADWDIGALNENTGSFDPGADLCYLSFENGDTSMYRGVAVLSAKGLSGHYIQNMSEFGNLRNPFTESFKYKALSSGFTKATEFEQGDLAHFTTTGPYSIRAGDSAHAVFAIVAGNSLLELQTAVTAAHERLDSVLAIEETPGTSKPTTFRLEQNFPNPFNPATRIEYALEKPGQVTLTIFNVLGQKVRELVNARQESGVYKVNWDGADDNNARVASGMYFYRLKRGEQTLTRKMILLK